MIAILQLIFTSNQTNSKSLEFTLTFYLHEENTYMALSLHEEGRFVVPYHYTKRGGMWGRINTLRGQVCVAVSLH